MRASLLIVFFLLAAGCTSDDETTPAAPPPEAARGGATEVLRGDAPAEAAPDPALADRIRDAYGESRGAGEALAYAEAFRTARTDADFRAAYDRALALDAPDFDDDFDGLRTFTDGAFAIPGVIGSCAAECTIAVYALDLAAWKAAARRTGATDALAFFEALEAVYREEPRVHDGGFAGYPATFEQTWDYGGFSTLGAGRYTHTLDAVARALASGTTPFRAPLQALRDALLDEAANTVCIGGSPSAARAELARLRERDASSPDQRAALTRQHEALAAPSRNGIETGCADFKAGGCACASG